jgi:CRISPR-associated protein Csd1
MLVTDREKVRAYWKRERARIEDDPTRNQRCLVSGRSCSPVELFPPLMKVPGKNTSKGIALVSFNTNAFESYDWKGNANAPISRDAAESCSTALNRLLHPAYPVPSGGTLPRRNLQLSADTVVCFWSPKSDSDFCSAFAGLLEANPDEVKELYRSLWRGKLADIDDPSAFYALTLSGTQGRAIVRDLLSPATWLAISKTSILFAIPHHPRAAICLRNSRLELFSKLWPPMGREKTFPLRSQPR